ncbi:MAG TPA: alpha/beta hydrolase [Xanthobacteraceae bacterium]|nr:alpha/beta hydrolase [Xanthobacteraceae bacterium]
MRFDGRMSRRAALGAAASVIAAPALAEECHIGPPEHPHGANVWMNMDQVELDAAYDQSFYAPLARQILARVASDSELARQRLGLPRREAYGPSEVEKLDIWKTKHAKAPIFLFIHGGAWLAGEAKNYAYPAEMFVNAGAHFVVPDFIQIRAANGDLRTMAEQVRRAIAWTYKNAASFDGDPERLYIGGHSSGGHLCGVALVTDWQKEFGLPPTILKGGACMSGMYDMKPVRLSQRGNYIHFTDEMEQAMSSQRHLDLIRAPIVATYGTNETPEFQRQNRDFAAALKAAGKPVELIEGKNYNHFEMMESVGHPYGPNGRAILAMMKLSAA